MTSRRPQNISRSLTKLGKLVNRKKRQAERKEKRPQASKSADQPPKKTDTDLFAEAMADVTPLSKKAHWQIPPKKYEPSGRRDGRSPSKTDNPEIAALQRLIETGEGFRAADTSEYKEAAGPGVDRALVRRLHQGRYPVQGHLDLHGFTRADAEQVLFQFIQNALTSGKRMVLVIHGRGLTSPGQPVLKNMVYTWLTRGPLRRFVLAFTSARSCDGGTGATYVLLRKRPWTKRDRKNR